MCQVGARKASVSDTTEHVSKAYRRRQDWRQRRDGAVDQADQGGLDEAEDLAMLPLPPPLLDESVAVLETAIERSLRAARPDTAATSGRTPIVVGVAVRMGGASPVAGPTTSTTWLIVRAGQG